MSAALVNQVNEELEKNFETRYRVLIARTAELEAIGRDLIVAVRRINSNIDRLRAIREEQKEELKELRNGC